MLRSLVGSEMCIRDRNKSSSLLTGSDEKQVAALSRLSPGAKDQRSSINSPAPDASLCHDLKYQDPELGAMRVRELEALEGARRVQLQLDQAEQRLAELEKEVGTGGESSVGSQKEMVEMRAQVRTAMAAQMEAQHQVLELQDQLQSSQSKSRDSPSVPLAADSRTKLQDTFKDLSRELNKATEEAATARAQLMSLQKQMEHNTKQAEAATEEIARLKAEVTRAQNDAEYQCSRAEEALATGQFASSVAEAAQEEATALEAELAQVRSQVAILTKVVVEQKEAILSKQAETLNMRQAALEVQRCWEQNAMQVSAECSAEVRELRGLLETSEEAKQSVQSVASRASSKMAEELNAVRDLAAKTCEALREDNQTLEAELIAKSQQLMEHEQLAAKQSARWREERLALQKQVELQNHEIRKTLAQVAQVEQRVQADTTALEQENTDLSSSKRDLALENHNLGQQLKEIQKAYYVPVSYTHLRAHETPEHLVCRLLLEKKKNKLIMTKVTYLHIKLYETYRT
eukprot:TRINITY_DN19573_c0_g3_i1.p1 TRINITY_DN19573_c0_g3~~TRINITY_DN19573_c0_g3_i1.p1  ORF type:complete len:518 (+),score=171.95 TRINITY_DN19573_c0_g3_i1:108-1661(+)